MSTSSTRLSLLGRGGSSLQAPKLHIDSKVKGCGHPQTWRPPTTASP